MWELNTNANIILTEPQLEQLHPVARAKIKHHSYINKDGLIILSFDGAQYINHSDDPNLMDQDYNCYALRDIEAGEEITANYYASEPKAEQKLNGAYL